MVVLFSIFRGKNKSDVKYTILRTGFQTRFSNGGIGHFGTFFPEERWR